MSKPILITGATGKQGGSVIRALLAHPAYSPTTHPIYALTRSPSSASAQKLAALSPSITLIPGDLNNTPAIFAALPAGATPWAVFSVQLPGKHEVAQGTALVDAAVTAHVRRFVYTSVERGGRAKSDRDPTAVPHFRTKYEIEKHLLRKAGETRTTTAAAAAAGHGNGTGTGTDDKADDGAHAMTYTILRPVFFLDNFEWGFAGKLIATAWRDHVGPATPLQVIDTADIGPFGAAALLEPDNPAYRDQALSLAGDSLTWAQAQTVFRDRSGGKEIPVTYGFLATALLWVVADVGRMFDFFRTEGFGADVDALRGMEAGRGLKGFGEWVEGSGFGRGKGMGMGK
ncbi:hypothetical protein MMC19_003513 [Ptychographa xylographoides]|nr:hypothetical protein [Ptychographa xylographoides]